MIGICFYNYFLFKNKGMSIVYIINHIEYVLYLVGAEYVGFEGDFDRMENLIYLLVYQV